MLFAARRNVTVDDFLIKCVGRSEGRLKQDNVVRLGNSNRVHSHNLNEDVSRFYFKEQLVRWRRKQPRKARKSQNRETDRLFKKICSLEKRLQPNHSMVNKSVAVTISDIIKRSRSKRKQVLHFDDFWEIKLPWNSKLATESDLSSVVEQEEESSSHPEIHCSKEQRQIGIDDSEDEKEDFAKGMTFSKLNNLETFASSSISYRNHPNTSMNDDLDDDYSAVNNNQTVFNLRDFPLDFTLPPGHESIYHKDSKEMNDSEKLYLIYTQLRKRTNALLSHIAKQYAEGMLKIHGRLPTKLRSQLHNYNKR